MTVSAYSSEGATISWNAIETLDTTQFKDYKITVKYNDTESRTLSSLTNSYEITGLDPETDYEIWVIVDTVDYGESEIHETKDITTSAYSVSDWSDIEILRNQVVKLNVHF